MDFSPLTVDDFSGGFTENYVGANIRQCKANENLLIQADRSPIVRPGSAIYDSTNYQIPAGNQRLDTLMDYDNGTDLFYQSARAIYYVSGGAWATLTGPSSNPALSAGSAGDKVSVASWKKHLFITNDSGSAVMKLYKDNGGVYRIRNAGLPALTESAAYTEATELTNAINLANDLQTQFLAHMAHYSVIKTCATTNLSTTVTPSGGVSGLVAGMNVYGPDIPQSTTIATIGASTITISNAATATATAAKIWFSNTSLHTNKSANITNGSYSVATSGFAYGTRVFGKAAEIPNDMIVLYNESGVSMLMNKAFTATTSPASFYGVTPAAHAALDPARATLAAVPVASNLATLKTLTIALIDAYQAHITDAKLGASASYHTHIAEIAASYENEWNHALADTSDPTDLVECAARLDDLRLCLLLHDQNRHSHTNDYQFDVKPPTEGTTLAFMHRAATGFITMNYGKIGPLITGVKATPNLTELLTYVNDLRTKMNAHFADTNLHWYADSINTIQNSAATDLPTCQILLQEMYNKIFHHVQDAYLGTPSASTGHYGSGADSTSGSKTIGGTSVSGVSNGMYIHAYDFTTKAHVFPEGSIVTATSGTSLDGPVNATATYTNTVWWHANYSRYHAFQDNTTVSDDLTASYQAAADLTDIDAMLVIYAALVTFYNSHDADTGSHTTQNNPEARVSLHQHKLEAPTSTTRIYALHYFYEYTVGNVTFQDLGPVLYTGAIDSMDSADNGASLSNIPAISNGSTDNYDTSNIKVKIYRTDDEGTTYYYVTEITNGTTTATDKVTDELLVANERLYTTGGIVDNDPPPLAKYIHIVDGIGWYGNITENSQNIGNRIRQSIANDPDSCPGDFFVDLDEDVTGISSHLSRVIAFSKKSVYRLAGTFDERGQGAIAYDKIHAVDGCVSHRSIVQIPEGLVYAGQAGFYFTDGYRVVKLNDHWPAGYKLLVASTAQASKIQGMYDPVNRRVWWTVQSNGASDNDKVYVLDLKWGIGPDACFSYLTGSTSFAPTYLLYYNQQILRADKRGYTFYHTDSLLSDPTVDTAVAPSSWATRAIIYDFTSAATDFGAPGARKWVPSMSAIFQSTAGKLSVQTNVINDDGRLNLSLKEIRARSVTGIFDRKLMMARRGLRCQLHQVQFTNSLTIITNSDTLGTASINGTTKAVTISGTWPTDCVGHSLAFVGDGYTATYTITARNSGTVVTVSDPGGALVNAAGVKWVMKGYPKDEQFQLVSFTLNHGVISNTQKTYQTATGDAGANA